MTARTPSILAAVVLVFGAYLYVFEWDGPKQSEVEAREGFLLAPLVRERVTRIRLDDGETKLSLRREGEGYDEQWFLETDDGEEAEADTEAVEDLLRNWEYAVPTRVLESPTDDDMTAFGLTSPRASITFEMGRTAVRAALGTGNPVDGGGYLRVDERRQAIVVPNEVVTLFDVDLERLRAPDGTQEPTLDDLVAPTEEGAPDAEPAEPARSRPRAP